MGLICCRICSIGHFTVWLTSDACSESRLTTTQETALHAIRFAESSGDVVVFVGKVPHRRALPICSGVVSFWQLKAKVLLTKGGKNLLDAV